MLKFLVPALILLTAALPAMEDSPGSSSDFDSGDLAADLSDQDHSHFLTVTLDLAGLPTAYNGSSTTTKWPGTPSTFSGSNSGNVDTALRTGVLGIMRFPRWDPICWSVGASVGAEYFQNKKTASDLTDETKITVGFLDLYGGSSWVFHNGTYILDALVFVGGQAGGMSEKIKWTSGLYSGADLDYQGSVFGIEYGARLGLTMLIRHDIAFGAFLGYYGNDMKDSGNADLNAPPGGTWISTGSSRAKPAMEGDTQFSGFMFGVTAGVHF